MSTNNNDGRKTHNSDEESPSSTYSRHSQDQAGPTLLEEFAANGDNDAKAATSLGVDRAATAVMGANSYAMFGAMPGMGPVEMPHQSYQAQPRQDQFAFNLGPAKKSVPASSPAAGWGMGRLDNMQSHSMPMAPEASHLFGNDEDVDLPDSLGVLPDFNLDISSDMMSFMDMEDDVDDQIPPPAPADFNQSGLRATAVVSKEQPQHTRDSVTTSLQIMATLDNNNLTWEQEGWQIVGAYVHNGRDVRFQIDVSQTDEEHAQPNAIIVEFRRLRGGAHAFQRFYRQCVSYLKMECRLEGLNGPLPMETLDLQIDLSDMPPPSQQDVIAAAAHCMGMCQSIGEGGQKPIEPRREATASLAQLSSRKENAELLLDVCVGGTTKTNVLAGCIQMTKECADDFDVVINTCRAFSNLMERASNQKNLKTLRSKLFVWKMFDFLCTCLNNWTSERLGDAASAAIICGELCRFMRNIASEERKMVWNRYSPSQDSIETLQRVATAKLNDQLSRVQQECRTLLSIITSQR